MSLILSGTDGLSDVDGTAATPAIRGTDANTGMFFPAADTIAFSEGGVEAMRLDSAGNVGIGTSSPVGKFQVSAGRTTLSANNENFALQLNNGSSPNGPFLGSSGLDTFVISTSGGTERMRIDSSGNLLVGTTVAALEGQSTNYGLVLDRAGSRFVSATNNNYNMVLNRIGGDGAVAFFQRSGTNVGNISVTTSATAYNTSSDYRLKNTIAPMTGALAKVAALKPCTYKWNADNSDGEGFIAHELQEVVPDAVTGAKDAVDADGKPVYQGIDTSFLVATLTAAMQEQQKIIESLTARVAQLEAK